MYPNLKAGSVFKDLLLGRLSYAVIFSVLAQTVIILLFISGVNFNTHPTIWFKNTISKFTSPNILLYLILFTSIVFIQIVISAKEYVLSPNNAFTRFQKLTSIIRFQFFLMGFLHVLVGYISVWLYLSLSEVQFPNSSSTCGKDCLFEGYFFVLLSGVWTGLYYFLRVYLMQRNLIFPVIHQSKILHFKAKFLPLLRESRNIAFYPIVYYFISYYLCGNYLYNLFAFTFKFHIRNEGFNLFLYFYVWLFIVLYTISMKLMRFFFEIFLTEPVEYPIMAVYDSDTSLSEALLVNNIPILQHLAGLDLYLLSLWSPQRRQTLFTLSQPGGHPHTWNRLIQGATQLISEFTATLNKSTDALLIKEEKPKVTSRTETINYHTPSTSILQSPMQSSTKYQNMRNMTLSPVQHLSIVDDLQSEQYVDNGPPIATRTLSEKMSEILNVMKNIRVIKYWFGELPDAHIQHCLKNGQIIVWTAQGLANILVASYKEDPYGVVQKDLPVLITCLIELKQSIEKLNKVPLFSRKGPTYDEFSYKMKNNVNAAIKRSLFSICRTFGKHLNELSLKNDVIIQLQCYL